MVETQDRCASVYMCTHVEDKQNTLCWIVALAKSFVPEIYYNDNGGENIKLWQHCLNIITKTAAFWKIILWTRAHLFVRYIRSYTVLQHKRCSGCIISWRTMIESRSCRRNVMQTMDNISIFHGFNTFVYKKYCFLFFNGHSWTFYPSATDWIHLVITISL